MKHILTLQERLVYNMLSIIVAVDQNMGIGHQNQLPWNYPEDLKYFKSTTLQHTIVMGNSTYQSIGKALPNRDNIVISRDNQLQLTDAQVETNPLSFFQAHENTQDEIFVIGGEMIYELALPYVQRIYLTKINKAFTVDTYFPQVNWLEYHVVKEQQSGDLTFFVYERKK